MISNKQGAINHQGFTLAELLIALAILGVIATFTIPKVLQSTSSGQNTAIAKEAASMVSGAFSAFQLNNTIASTTGPDNLTQFMNYVKVDTATTFTAPTSGTALDACVAARPCLQLHNGAFLQYSTTNDFGGTSTTHAIKFNVDPDGAGTGVGRITFIQLANGRLTTGGIAVVNTDFLTTDGATVLAEQNTDPSYLQNWN